MPIRFGTSRGTLNLTSASDRDKASLLQSFREGQTLNARVMDRAPDGKWVLRILGQDLLAESQQALTKGQTVRAQVTHAGPPVLLAIVEEVSGGGEALGQALRDLGLSDDPESRAVLGRMIARQMPLDGATIQQVRDALKGAGINLADRDQVNRTLDALLSLAARSVPISPGVLEAALAGAPPGALSGMILSLLDLVRDLSPGLRNAMEADARALERLVSDLVLNGAELPEEGLRRVAQDGGMGLEGKLERIARGLAGREGLESLSRGDLKAALLRLRASLDNLDAAGGADAGAMEELQGGVNRVLQHLSHLQVLNLPARNDPDPHLLLQIPVLFGQERAEAELRIHYDGQEGRRKIDPENFRAGLRLDLANLGRVDIDLQVVSRVLDCRIRVDGTAQQDLFEGERETLRAGLEGTGYRVQRVACEVRPQPSEGQPDPPRPTRIGLDLKA